MNTKNKASKPIIIGLGILILILSLVVEFIIYQKQVKEPAAVAAKQIIVDKKVDTKIDSISKEQYKTLKGNLSSVRSTFGLIHEMANTKIEAEDELVWGKTIITPGGCKALLEFYADHKQEAQEVLGENDYEDLVDGIAKWSKEDYSKSARVHNIVWSHLGATNGKAKEN